MKNFNFLLPQSGVLISAGRKIGENVTGPWLDRMIDKVFDTIEKAINESKNE